MAKTFNDFFTNIGSSLARKIPPSNIDPISFLKGDYQNSLFFTPVTEQEIIQIIGNLKNTNSKGFDDIPVNVLKFCRNELATVLSHINNLSLSSGVFPNVLKIAKVLPIFKNGDKKIVSNYRPISVLSVFSKIFEKIVYTRLFEYLDVNHILSNSQFGFRQKLSTSMALLELTDVISKCMDSKNFTVGVFLDLAKAFDTVDHGILLAKLNHYGVRGISNNWFRSYLATRRQYVTINGVSSDFSNITCGVPQGSILGPLLFIVYINDLNTVSEILRTIMFADDTNLFMSGTGLDEIELRLNVELKLVTQWFQTNLLSLNVSKTSYIIFGNRSTHNLKLFMQGVELERLFETKFLGVIINHKLSWKSHMLTVSNKMCKNIGIIAKIRHLLPPDQVRMLYLALVEPYMSYCCIVWAGVGRTGCLERIHKIQKRYCRLITFSEFRAHSAPLFRGLQLMTVYNMFRYQASLYMYKHLKGLLPKMLFDFQFNRDIHSHFTRQGHKLRTDFSRTRCRQLSFQTQGPKVWNDLPDEFTNLPLAQFKKQVKTYLLNTC